MTTDTHTKTALFFAYGTLRKGQRLHDWIADEVIQEVGTGTMKGARLFYSSTHRAFPYLVMTDNPNDRAVGEIYEVPLNDSILAMLQMEQNAGYTIVESIAEFDGVEYPVIVCEWRHEYGEPVTDNDWIADSRKEWW